MWCGKFRAGLMISALRKSNGTTFEKMSLKSPTKIFRGLSPSHGFSSRAIFPV
jgi:hypothetical protein